MKNVTIRTDGLKTTPDKESLATSFGGSVIGFLATKYNLASGYIVSTVTEDEIKEFGSGVVRISSEKTLTTSIGIINAEKGTVQFLNNDAYLEGNIKFLRAEKYDRLIVDTEEGLRYLKQKMLYVELNKAFKKLKFRQKIVLELPKGDFTLVGIGEDSVLVSSTGTEEIKVQEIISFKVEL